MSSWLWLLMYGCVAWPTYKPTPKALSLKFSQKLSAYTRVTPSIYGNSFHAYVCTPYSKESDATLLCNNDKFRFYITVILLLQQPFAITYPDWRFCSKDIHCILSQDLQTSNTSTLLVKTFCLRAIWININQKCSKIQIVKLHSFKCKIV